MKWTFAISGILLMLLLIAYLVPVQNILLWDFRNNLWAPAHLLVSGQSPYVITGMFPDSNAVWFPMAIGAFFPLGWLNLTQASMFWLLATVAAAIILIFLSAGESRPKFLLLAISLMMIFIQPRVYAHLKLGQVTIFATLLFLLAAYALKDRKFFWTAVLLSVALSKPQLGVFVVPGIFLSVYRWRGKKGTLFLGGYFVLMLGLLSLPLFLAYPSWWEGFIWALNRNHAWLQPTIYSLLPRFWGKWEGLAVWSVLAILLFVINLHAWWIWPPQKAIYWSLALTPLVTPYLWSWDIVLVLPLLIRALFELNTKKAHILLIGGYMLSWWLTLQVLLRTDSSDHYFWWTPWMLVLLILSSYWVDGRRLESFLKPNMA